MTEAAPDASAEALSADDLVAEIVAEADAARASGKLPQGYEDELVRVFDLVARDPAALEREVTAGALSKRPAYRAATPATPAGEEVSARPVLAGRDGARDLRSLAVGAARRSVRTARVVSRRGLGSARRVAGPRVRSLERRYVDRAGQAAEVIATQAHVTADHARRVVLPRGTPARLARISPLARALPPSPSVSGPAGSSAALGHLRAPGDDAHSELEAWVAERLRRDAGAVLHVECGDGAFVRRLSVDGFDAMGADPGALAGSASVAPVGAFEYLGSKDRASLAGLVLSGITERMTPGTARAIVHLASRRVQGGGVVVIVSAYPSAAVANDPIASDLGERRPLHPVTWCHLLARYGFGEITVFDPAAGRPSEQASRGTLYAVAARRQ